MGAAPSSGVWGTSFALTGALSCNGNLLGGKAVTQKRWAGGTWTTVASGEASDENAAFSFTQKPSHNETYKVSSTATRSANLQVLLGGTWRNAASVRLDSSRAVA